LAARARPCAARTRLFGLFATPDRALRAPPPIAASLLPPNKKNYFQKQNVSLLAMSYQRSFKIESFRSGAFVPKKIESIRF
jgi:hypothetical protein